MDIKEYISSGLLENYVLGSTTPQEKKEVEAMMQLYPEIAKEIAQMQETLEKYVKLHAQIPPTALKEKTRKAIFEKKQAIKFTHNPNNISSFNWRSAASWALLAISTLANLYLFSKWQNTQERLLVADAKAMVVAKNEQVLKANYEYKINIMLQDEFKKIILKGTPNAPSAVAVVYFNPKNNTVVLSSLKMPKIPKGKQYQLWAIIDGKPVDAGLIENKIYSNGNMKSVANNATAFAISIEDIGGSTTVEGPKGAVLAIGNV